MSSTRVATDEFDPTVRVGEGITVLEASAGTGKTHAVASLVVHEVAEGRPLDQLLVVTFTRKATGTLRQRVWQRLNEAALALAAGTPNVSVAHDELLAHLRRGTVQEVEDRHSRLCHALSNFDAATIATTHGFCQQVLASVGVAGDAERDLELLEDVSDLVDDAVDDLFVRRFHAGDQVLFPRSVARGIAATVVANPDCLIAEVDDHAVDRMRRQFAVTLRQRIVDQKRRGRLVTYDDLLSRLEASITDPENGRVVAERLRQRFTMAVVDEFQDTDTVQWRILERAFGEPPCRLVLVGDPKQAIYAFRGGDVFAYLEATRHARTQVRLPVSWRADRGLLRAQNAFFAGAQLGHRDIKHQEVRARDGAPERGLSGPRAGEPMTVRIVDRSCAGLPLTQDGVVTKGAARDFVAQDLAATVVRLLDAGTTIEDGDLRRPVRPSDIAVLARTRHNLHDVHQALLAVGVPAVVHRSTNVIGTQAAQDWLDLLAALEQPASTTRVHAVAIGPFFGWPASRLATATDTEWEQVDSALHEWAEALRIQAVAGLLRSVEATNGITARLLGEVGGERRLTDLRHIAELLDARQSAQPASVAALSGWLAEQNRHAQEDGIEQARRRLESDADAVAIHTVHGAKGLEFPIVLLPSVWDAPWERDDEIPVFHDSKGNRSIGVGGAGQIHGWQVARAAEERDHEDLRLLYVAVTRAKYQVITWWATTLAAQQSAFARILLGTDPTTGAVVRTLQAWPDESAVTAELARRGIAFEDASGADGVRYQPAPAPATTLSVAPYHRSFDRRWVRTSYSGLTRAAHDLGAPVPAAIETVEVDERVKVDEPDISVETAPAEGPLAATLPLGGVPGGARVGTLVHEVLEHTDFAAADLAGELAAAATEAGARRIVTDHVDTLTAGLALALRTPLGTGWDGRRLCDLSRTDRLDELEFDLPLGGGDHPDPAEAVNMTAIADAFTTLPGDDPLAGYHERLRRPLLATEVRGFLNGSIDLVARLGERHIVVDYKTNLLAPPGEPPVAWHYRPEALTAAMQDAHYPLQAALYAVALHRFLRWRQLDYDPARHLGGVSYLFLRGMAGPDVPPVDDEPCGVFSWRPPARFVTDLSDVLDGRARVNEAHQ